MQLLVQGDSLVALAPHATLGGSQLQLSTLWGLNFSLALEAAGVERIEPLHIPGVLNIAPDYLSRPSKWSAQQLPSELEGIKVEEPARRSADFYTLPSPAADPSLWGAEDVAAVGSAAWEHILWDPMAPPEKLCAVRKGGKEGVFNFLSVFVSSRVFLFLFG